MTLSGWSVGDLAFDGVPRLDHGIGTGRALEIAVVLREAHHLARDLVERLIASRAVVPAQRRPEVVQVGVRRAIGLERAISGVPANDEHESDPLSDFVFGWMKAVSPELREEFAARMETTAAAGAGVEGVKAWMRENDPRSAT